MATVATLDTVMRLNSTAFRQGMVQAAAQANSSLSSISKQAQATASVLLSLKRAADTFGSFYLLKEGITSLIQAQTALQSIQFGFQAATGSATLAADAFAFVQGEASKLGLALPGAAQEFAKLSAAATASGVSMSSQKELFDAFAKSSTTLHLSADQSSRALLALQEMFSRGTIQSRQLNQQLGQAIPGSAARFKNAVMSMTAGTDLAGKSFEQLIQGGKLVTSQFLPALITALQGSASGWEEASNGLNANLNRVQTAWFNLKAEVTSGLFTDVASASARLLADNLTHVAGALQLVAGLAAARGLSSVLQQGLGAGQYQVQNYQGAKLAAAAEITYAQAQAESAVEAAAEATALRDSAAQKLASVEASRTATLQARQEAEAQYALAAATKATADSNVARLAGSVLPANTKFAGTAQAAAASAQKQLAAAQATYNTTVAASNALKIEANAQNSVLIKSNLALAAAEDAVAAAQARVAETQAAQLALGGLGAAAARAASSFKNFALGLVGGPWGLAIAAIGALTLGFFSARSEAEHLEEQTKDNAKSVQDLIDKAVMLRAEFGMVGNSAPLSQLQDSMGEIGTAITQNIAKLKALSDAQDHTPAGMSAKDPAVAISSAAITAWDKLTGKYQAAQDAAAQLEAAQEPLQAQYDASQVALLSKYGDSWNGVSSVLESMTGSVHGLVAGFDQLGPAMNGALSNKAVIDKARQDLAKYQEDVEAAAEASTKKLRQKFMTDAQRAQDDLNQARKAATTGNSGGIGDQAEAAAELNIQNLKGIEAAEAAKKAAEEAAAQAKRWANEADNLTNSIAKNTAEVQEQLGATAKLTPAQKELASMVAGTDQAFNHSSASQKAADLVAQKYLVTLELQRIAQEQAAKDAEAWAASQEQLANIATQSARSQADALNAIGQGSQEAQRAAQLTDLKRKYEDLAVAADKAAVKGTISPAELAAQKAAYSQQLADQEDALAKSNAAIDAAKANWNNGFKTGIANFMTEQQNNAAQAESLVSNFTSGFSNAFVDFADGSKTASDAFGSMIDDMYKKALAFLADKAIQAFFDSFGNGANQTAGTTNGGWGSLFSNFASYFSSGGSTPAAASFSSLAGSDGFSSLLNYGTLGSGGSFAGGGTAAPNGSYRVNENGPETATVGGRTYLMTGDQPVKVSPTGTAGAGNTTVTNIYVQPTSTRRTADQIATANARTQRIATTRNS